MASSRRVWLTAVVALLALAAPALAEPGALEWIAPPACPDEAHVRSRVEQLSGISAATWPAEFAVRVRAARSGDTWRAWLAFPGAASQRIIEGETCAAVSEAAALHLALGLEELAPARAAGPGAAPDRPAGPRLALELTAGTLRPAFDDGEIMRYQSRVALSGEHLSVAAAAPLSRHLSLVGSLGALRGQYLSVVVPEEVPAPPQSTEHSWRAFLLGVHARASLPLLGGGLVPFVEAGGGLTMTDDDGSGDGGGSAWRARAHLRSQVGLAVRLSRRLAVLAGIGYLTAPGDGGSPGSGVLLTLGGRASID